MFHTCLPDYPAGLKYHSRTATEIIGFNQGRTLIIICSSVRSKPIKHYPVTFFVRLDPGCISDQGFQPEGVFGEQDGEAEKCSCQPLYKNPLGIFDVIHMGLLTSKRHFQLVNIKLPINFTPVLDRQDCLCPPVQRAAPYTHIADDNGSSSYLQHLQTRKKKRNKNMEVWKREPYFTLIL